jgi:hypothetical protein
LREEAQVFWPVLINEVSREHNVKAMTKVYTGSCKLEVIVLSILSNKFESRSFKGRAEISKYVHPPLAERTLRVT